MTYGNCGQAISFRQVSFAGSNPGSGALMGSHGLHSIERTFPRMWLDPRRVGDLLKFCDVNFSWHLVNVFFDAFLVYSKCSDR